MRAWLLCSQQFFYHKRGCKRQYQGKVGISGTPGYGRDASGVIGEDVLCMENCPGLTAGPRNGRPEYSTVEVRDRNIASSVRYTETLSTLQPLYLTQADSGAKVLLWAVGLTSSGIRPLQLDRFFHKIFVGVQNNLPNSFCIPWPVV